MGNKQGKLEGGDRTDSKKKKSASVHDITATHNDHGGGGNTASPFVRDFRSNGGGRAGYKRYQSYSGPSTSGSSKPRGGSSPSEGKSYHQNPASAPTGGRYRSLPRSAGTSARNRSQSVTSNVYQSNGTLNGEPVDVDGHVTYKRYAHIPASGHHSNMNDTIRASTTRLNSTYSGHGTGYRHGSNYRAVTDDFPDTAAIKRRLAQFETQFERCFTALYSRLDETVQLDCVPVAFCLGGPSTRRHLVSLYQYLTLDAIPQDLNQPQQTGRDRYILTVPEALFQDAKRIRSQRVRDQTRWLSLAKEIASGVAVEVAEELSRMFEYQIALLGDGTPVDLLAGHAVQSAVEYVKAGNGFLERSTLFAGVLGGGLASAKVFSVFVGGREFKWNLSQIFQKCGLRKETLLFGPRSRDSTKFVPWTHHESTGSMAQVYGYRGIALDRDPVHGYYVVVREDEIQFASQTARRSPDDLHTRYCPYRRLIGKEVMDEYCRSTKDAASVTLAEYVLKLQGYEYSRDSIQPIYRPLGMVSGLSKGSRIGTSVSSLLLPSSSSYAGAATTNRAPGGRHHEERERRPRSQFANGEQAQAPPVFLRNNSTSSPNGHSQRYHPRMGRSSGERGYRSESCSVASDDFGEEHGGCERDGEGGGGSTFARNDAHQQRRAYQSQRPNSSKSVSGPTSYNYVRSSSTSTSPVYATVTVNCKPGPGFDQAQTVHRGSTTSYHGPPKSPDSGFNQTLSRGSTIVNNQSQKPEQEIGNSVHAKDREFLDFKAFLGMIKQDENDEIVPEINPNDKSNSVNGHYDTAKYDLGPSSPRRIGVYSHESNKAYDNSASSVNDGVYNNRRPAFSHI